MKKYISIFVFALGVSIMGTTLNAQETPSTENAEIVATVNIYDAKLVSQLGNTFNISFDLYNREGTQTGVKYGVLLTNINDNSPADEKVFAESFNMGTQQTIHKNIKYAAPQTIATGKYKLWIESKNDKGFPFGSAYIGEVSLSASSMAFVNILSESCFITIKNSTSSEKYTLLQGVDINEKESLVLHCDTLSTFKDSIPVTPNFITYFRSIFGEEVGTFDNPNTSIVIQPGTSSFSIDLPKATDPQSYDTILTFTQGNKIVSNEIRSHYVIRGSSGSIQNIILDKSSYVSGDLAKVKVFWTAAVDGFANARGGDGTNIGATNLNIILKSNDETCSLPVNYSTKQSVVEVPVSITNDCPFPVASITLSGVDQEGNSIILDKKDDTKIISSLNNENINYKIIIAVIFILFIIFFYLKRGNIKHLFKSIFIFLIIIISFSGQEAKADSYVLTWGPPAMNPQISATTFTVNMNKAIYAPSEEGNVTGQIVESMCNNANSKSYIYNKIDSTRPAVTVPSIWPTVTTPTNLNTFGTQLVSSYYGIGSTGGTGNGAWNFTAPVTLGNHNLKINYFTETVTHPDQSYHYACTQSAGTTLNNNVMTWATGWIPAPQGINVDVNCANGRNRTYRNGALGYGYYCYIYSGSSPAPFCANDGYTEPYYRYMYGTFPTDVSAYYPSLCPNNNYYGLCWRNGGTSTIPFTVVAATFNFSLSNGGNKTVTKGQSVTNTITATAVSGTQQTTTWSVSGLPTGATASFSPTAVTPTASSTMTINTSASTPTGTFPITITGVAGSVLKTTSFNLVVVAPNVIENGQCSLPQVHYTCASGSTYAAGSGVSSPSRWTWRCNSSTGGAQSPLCIEDKGPGYIEN